MISGSLVVVVVGGVKVTNKCRVGMWGGRTGQGVQTLAV